MATCSFLTFAYDILWSRHDEIVHHKRRYRRGEFEQLVLGAGFEVARSSYVSTLLFPLILAIRLLQQLGCTES